MKKILVLVLFLGLPAYAQDQSAGLKETLQNLWGKLREATPRSSPPPATTATVTAGLRGIEATESELKPYWRGDDRQAFDNAQALADAGKFAEAAAAFDALAQANPAGALAPSALFGAALARAAAGDRARARAGFEDFIKRDPGHPLAAEAKRALAALR
jgi:TolA-binding protein